MDSENSIFGRVNSNSHSWTTLFPSICFLLDIFIDSNDTNFDFFYINMNFLDNS